MRISLSKEKATIAVGAGVLLAAAAAIAGSNLIDSWRNEAVPATTPDKPRCLTLTSMNLIGGNKDGHVNAKNTGECFSLYDQRTQQSIGAIVAKDGAFSIDCWDYAPYAFKVETPDHATGYVKLDGDALQQFEHHQLGDEIPACTQPTPTPTAGQ